MYSHKIDGTHISFLHYISLLIFIILYGCTTTYQPAGPSPNSAPLPAYKTGTTFVYSDGTWETVTAVSPKQITWRDHRGYVSSGSPDFTYRRAKWQSKNRRGFREFTPLNHLLAKPATSLWPLQKGNVSGYSVRRTTIDNQGVEKTSQVEWSCQVKGNETVSVMAGDFDTWKITCSRYNISRNNKRSRVRESTTWYYAPKVNHYIMVIRNYYYSKNTGRLQLLAVLPPSDGLSVSARHRMDEAFQKAMEFRKSGESVPWSMPDTAWSGEITPTGTFRLSDGRYSRRFIHKLNLPDGQRTYYGLALRNANGKWIIPRRK